MITLIRRSAAIALLISLLLALVHCDQTPAPSSPSATNSAANKITAPGQTADIEQIQSFKFDSDQSFARFAQSLEPSLLKLESSGFVNSDHLFAQGTQVLGTSNFKANYVLWTIDAKAGKVRSQSLLEEPIVDVEQKKGFSTATSKSAVAANGDWAYVVWPVNKDLLRPELWRLRGDESDRPTRFHTFDAQELMNFERASISHDGQWMLCHHAGLPTLVKVDARQGSIKTFSLQLADELQPSQEQRVFLRLAGHGLTASVERISGIDKQLGGTKRELGIGTLEVDHETSTAKIKHLHWLADNTTDSRSVTAMSPDGRWMFVSNYNSTEKAASTIWRLPEQSEQPPELIASLPQTATNDMTVAAWSTDGNRLAVGVGGDVYAFRTDELAKSTPSHSVSLRVFVDLISFDVTGAKIIALSSDGSHTTIPLDQPRELDVRIGEARIAWDVPVQPPEHTQWPALRFTGYIKHPTGGAPPALIAEVFNDGQGQAQQVRASLTVAPPLQSSAGLPANAQKISDLGLLHIGTLREGLSLRRFLDLPQSDALFSKARRFSLTVKCKYDFNPAPLHWLYLPRTLHDEEAYHKQAKLILDAASAALVKARGIAWEPPRLEVMGPSGYGFMVGYPRTVRYQNPYQMSQASLRINRAVMQVDNHDDLMRHAQMMLFWYLPHELVHCADHRRGWATEFVANTIQPYLTARMLQAMPDAPYSAQSMSYIYDRYVEKLAPHLTPDEIARVERFIESDGEGTGPWDMSAPDLFFSNTPAYVYFGARINQHSWAKQTNLEELCKRYLSDVKSPSNE